MSGDAKSAVVLWKNPSGRWDVIVVHYRDMYDRYHLHDAIASDLELDEAVRVSRSIFLPAPPASTLP